MEERRKKGKKERPTAIKGSLVRILVAWPFRARPCYDKVTAMKGRPSPVNHRQQAPGWTRATDVKVVHASFRWLLWGAVCSIIVVVVVAFLS